MPNRQAKRGQGKSRGTRSHKGGGRWDRLAEVLSGQEKHLRAEAIAFKQAPVAVAVGESRFKHDGRAMRFDHLPPPKCYLCQAEIARPIRKGMREHAPACPRRMVVRPCGICERPLPTDAPLSRKFHVGECDAEGERQMLERMKESGLRWPEERIQTAADLINAGVHTSYVSEEVGLAPSSLKVYASLWRRRGVVAKRLVSRIWWKGRAPKRRAPSAITTHYPFITAESSEENDLVMSIHAVVPKHLPEDIRSDVCQELLARVLSGEIAVEAIQEAVEPAIREVRKHLAPWQEVSLEAMQRASADRGMGKTSMLERYAANDELYFPVCPICHRPNTGDGHDICDVIWAESHRRGDGRVGPSLTRMYFNAANEGYALKRQRQMVAVG